MPAPRRRSPPRGPAAVASIPTPSSASYVQSAAPATSILDAGARPFLEHGNRRQGLALKKLEERSAAGRDVADPIADAELRDRRQRVAAAGDRERAAGRRPGHRQRQV